MSALEEAFAFQLKAYKIDGFVREYKFHATRKWRFDFCNIEKKIAIELHGGIFTNGRHARGAGIEGDMQKINEAQKIGYSVLCFSSGMVKSGEAILFVQDYLRT